MLSRHAAPPLPIHDDSADTAGGGPLMPVDQAILDRFLDPTVAALTQQEREQALAEGRDRPLAQVIDDVGIYSHSYGTQALLTIASSMQ
jgi:hypothetical protein